jgi:Spy/CpxP family protein refolding chaperone
MFRRFVVISSIALTLAGTAAMAQGFRDGRDKAAGRARAAGRRDAFAGRILDRLQQRPNLTDAQMNGIRALQETQRMETESLRQEMQQKRQALRQLMQEPRPNPSDVGNAMLALKESRDRARGISERFRSGVSGLLTPEQTKSLPKRLR